MIFSLWDETLISMGILAAVIAYAIWYASRAEE